MNITQAMQIIDANRPKHPVMSQSYFLQTLIGQNVSVVDVHFDYMWDGDYRYELENVVVMTPQGVEITQYLSDDQLSDIDMVCEAHADKILEAEAAEDGLVL